MKKIFLALCLLCGLGAARADEGMWLLKLMKEQHLEDSLRKAGLQLPLEELYSETRPSLRDVVGIFGQGCTGEIISRNGLVMTNNHCGFSYMHSISTLNKNYLQDGFFAKQLTEELKVPGLTFTFVVRIVDVTAQVKQEARKQGADVYTMSSPAFLDKLGTELLKTSDLKKKKSMSVRVVPYFGANRFYAFYEQTYKDVRLVANPPQQVAQFGFNQDNWMWPRHNADVTIFRIYADKHGEPADYNTKNKPLSCKKWLPISLRGVNEGDYTMVLGFPGRTSRYLTASQVKLRTESQNSPINAAGEAELNFMKSLMDSDKSAALKYADDYMSLGNMVKNFGGMNESVRKTGLMAIKAEEEKAFRAFAARSGKPEYANIIERIDSLVAAAQDTLHDFYLLRFTFGAQKMNIAEKAVQDFVTAFSQPEKKTVERTAEQLRKVYASTITPLDKNYDLQKMQLLAPYWHKLHKLAIQPDFVKEDLTAYFEQLYRTSVYTDSARFYAAVASRDTASLKNDALLSHWREISRLTNLYSKSLESYNRKAAELNQIYVRGLCEMYDWSKSPDANFTLRMTYGKVKPYSPRNAVHYDWKTDLSGMFEKENPNDPDYRVDEKLRQHYLAKDFGRYANDKGELPTCFISNNDITGGNSGSAVLNARGEIVGLAFDGNIESLSSDLRFNPALQRCINVDIRYVLYLLDIYGESKYLFDELDIRQ